MTPARVDAVKLLRELGRWCEEIAQQLDKPIDSPVDRAILEAQANHVVLAWRQRGVVGLEATYRGLMAMHDSCTNEGVRAQIFANAQQYADGKARGRRYTWTPLRAVLGAIEMTKVIPPTPVDTDASYAKKLADDVMRRLKTGDIATTDAAAIDMAALGRACLAWLDKTPGMKPAGKYALLATALSATSFAPSAATIKTTHHDRKSGRKAPAGRKKPPLRK